LELKFKSGGRNIILRGIKDHFPQLVTSSRMEEICDDSNIPCAYPTPDLVDDVGDEDHSMQGYIGPIHQFGGADVERHKSEVEIVISDEEVESETTDPL